jgi:iron(III) transport system substrate-binding protein
LFFGGGTYDFSKQAAAGRLVPSAVLQKHPEWFESDVIPQTHAGSEFRDRDGRWIGTVLSSYGIVYNRDSLRRLGITAPPARWADLAGPRYFGQVALCDPTKSGSISEAFENVIQQRMHLRLDSLRAGQPSTPARELEAQAVRAGWIEGLQMIQLIGANARYFTDSSQKPPIDVSTGDCAAGMCIDFYGRAEVEAVARRSGTDRLGFDSPPGGSAYSVDPIALLRGARHRAVAEAFIEFELSPEGQRLWNQKPGTPGGPERYALRRLPVRKDYYAHEEWRAFRSDPAVNPYDQAAPLIHRDEWTGGVFREMAFLIRVMCQDTHEELQAAWKAIYGSRQDPERVKAAMDTLQDLSFLSYDHANSDIKKALGSKNKVDEIRLATELAGRFRAQYAKAEALARRTAP